MHHPATKVCPAHLLRSFSTLPRALVLVVVAILVLPALTRAQMQEEDPSIRFRILSVTELPGDLFYLDGETERPLDLGPQRPSPILEIAQGPLRLFARSGNKDGEPVERELASWEGSAGVGETILLLRPASASAQTPFVLQPLPTGTDRAEGGTYALINLTDKRIAGFLDEERFSLSGYRPGKEIDAAVLRPDSDGSTVLFLRIAAETGDQWKREKSLDRRWVHAKRFDYLVLFLPERNSRGEMDVAVTRLLLAVASR